MIAKTTKTRYMKTRVISFRIPAELKSELRCVVVTHCLSSLSELLNLALLFAFYSTKGDNSLKKAIPAGETCVLGVSLSKEDEFLLDSCCKTLGETVSVTAYSLLYYWWQWFQAVDNEAKAGNYYQFRGQFRAFMLGKIGCLQRGEVEPAAKKRGLQKLFTAWPRSKGV